MENILQEHCWDAGKSWFSGGLSSRQIQVDYRSKIAAAWGVWSETREPQIWVFYQSPHEASIQAVLYNGYSHWNTGKQFNIPAVLGTGLGALVIVRRYGGTDLDVSLYYQESDCTVKVYSREDDRWKSRKCS